MLSLNVGGIGGTPSSVLLRESPTLASVGQLTSVAQGGGGFLNDSFFDIFFELSLDSGESWEAASGRITMQLNELPPPPFPQVPEPGSLMLLGSGILALGRMVWTRRRHTRGTSPRDAPARARSAP